jgi:hypothetical protein
MGLVVAALLASWAVLATLYAGPVWLLGFFLNRDLDWRGSWRLCGAALLPGALLMVGAIALYDLGVMDLVQMGFGLAAHLVLGWIFLLMSLFFVPRIGADGKSAGNPFVSPKKR